MNIEIGTQVLAVDAGGTVRRGEIVANPIESGVVGHGLPMVKWRGPHNMSSDRCTVYEHNIRATRESEDQPFRDRYGKAVKA